MACGVPVVAANAGALPETCGDAARYADPIDPDDIATQVLAAIGDDRLREAGPRRAALFTWERTARELDALLKTA
jgi:glycosyltransferase involved in cell wall biosynthesis